MGKPDTLMPSSRAISSIFNGLSKCSRRWPIAFEIEKGLGAQSPFQLAFVIHAGQNDSGINGRLARRVSQ